MKTFKEALEELGYEVIEENNLPIILVTKDQFNDDIYLNSVREKIQDLPYFQSYGFKVYPEELDNEPQEELEEITEEVEEETSNEDSNEEISENTSEEENEEIPTEETIEDVEENTEEETSLDEEQEEQDLEE